MLAHECCIKLELTFELNSSSDSKQRFKPDTASFRASVSVALNPVLRLAELPDELPVDSCALYVERIASICVDVD
jgi:hypothetical protein